MAAARVGLGRRLGKTPFLEAALRSPITLRAQCISTALDPANWHGLGLTLALTNVAAGDHWLTARVRRCLREHHSIPVLVSGLGSVSFVVRPWGATWRYRDNGTAPPATWTQLSFNDSAWKSGPAELGYGDFDETTVVEDNPTPGYNSGDTNRYITTWFRCTFTFTNAAQVITKALSAANLVEGVNVLAVEIHQYAADSSDISFNLELTAERPTTAPDPDTDGDGMRDLWEIANGFQYWNAADAAQDADADGTTNLAEFRLGLDPRNATLTPGFTLAWPSAPGLTFTIERTLTLAPANWLPIGTRTATGATTTFTDPSPLAGRSFYRVRFGP